MTKDSEKSEPSMDDILASIRKIIDEDGTKGRKPAASASGNAGSDILELTEMVNEDGSVTSLQKAQDAAPDLAPKALDDEEPPIYDDDHDERPTVFSAAEPARPTLAGDPKPVAPPVAPQASPPQQPPASSPTPPPPQPPRIFPTPSLGGISLTPVNTPPQSPAQPQSGQSGLVSGQTANAASAAFDRLAQAALQQQAPAAAPKAPSPTIGGRALEDMVAEMLKPMLQQWLDSNLPSIVERLVQQEIQKMSRR